MYIAVGRELTSGSRCGRRRTDGRTLLLQYTSNGCSYVVAVSGMSLSLLPVYAQSIHDLVTDGLVKKAEKKET
jgi:hypothetical protein